MPGHTTSWLVGHPEMAARPARTRSNACRGIFEPTLDPTNEKTYKFLKTFFKEMAALFPDAYMHIGGDENKGKQWDGEPDIQAFMKEKGIKDNHELQAYFNNRILEISAKAWQDNDGLGRDISARPAEGRRHPFVAWAKGVGRSRKTGLPRRSVERLLHRPCFSRFGPLLSSIQFRQVPL